ncbi:hypothetical protein LJ737_04915 [Hymenobacter sp. 15J16-1T3B]|uniref:hypothetical protein n=1 Tax=Hymenobacter sp. 15J16-1T3B TaxID=2886941 RepID=UPI001D0FB8B8|nr:hypothetical protein [Hymenobacter sp. 15J16-1T3B]MCC3156567.1 hypothetical protein [Hymenobacter sp. 15J16-1T3B]
MGKKHKKKKKQESMSDDLFDATALSIKKYRKVTNEIAKLSPLQKVVGGLALLAGGYFYLKNLQDDDWRSSPVAGLLPLPWRPGPRRPPAPYEDAQVEEDEPELAPRKHHKTPKVGKHAGAFGKKAAASPDEE